MITKNLTPNLNPAKSSTFSIRRMALMICCCLPSLLYFTTKAQVASYTFAQSTGIYTPITGGVVIVTNTEPLASGNDSAAVDDFSYAPVTIPFPFNFNGTPYTTLRAVSNGYIVFGGTVAVTGSAAISQTTVYDGAVSGLGFDLMGAVATTGDLTTGSTTIANVANTTHCTIGARIQGTGISAGTTITAFTANSITLSVAATAPATGGYISYTAAEIRAETIGTAPNRTFVVQFKSLATYSTSAAASNNTGFNYQVRLAEGGGVPSAQTVQIVYGSSFSPTATGTMQVGLRGFTNADYNNRTATAAIGWLATTAGTANSSTVAYSTAALPPSGLTFTWTPPTCFRPLALTATAITINSATINWLAPTPAPSGGYDVYYSTSATAPTASTTPTASTASLNLPISGLPFNTQQFVWVRSVCGGSDKSAWAPLPSFTTLIACAAPTAIVTGPVTSTTGYVSFTGTGNSYIVEYGAAGFTPGTGAAAGTGGTIVTGTGSPILISGLTANTNYDVYVRNNCTAAAFGYSLNSAKAILSTNGCVPQTVTATTPGVRCGTGTVNLGATASGGTLRWYNTVIGGTSLGSGTSFTTPSIAATTTYYVGAEGTYSGTAIIGAGGSTGTGVAYNFTNGGYGGMKTQYLYTAAELRAAGLTAGNITSIGINFTAAGATLTGFTVQAGTTTLTDFPSPVSIVGGLSTILAAPSIAPTVGLNTIPLTTPFNWDGISNIIFSVSWSNNNASNTSSTLAYDATTNYSSQSYRKDNETAPNMLAFTGPTGAGTFTYDRSQNRPKVTFGGELVCSSLRTAVVATVNTSPAFTVNPDSTVCNNAITRLTVTSTTSSYTTYVWNPIANLYTDAAATIPYVANGNATTVYFKSATAGNVRYIVSANNTTTLCANVDTVNVIVLPSAATATALLGTLCVSGSTGIVLNPSTGYGTGTIQWQSSPNNTAFTDISSANGVTYTSPTITATTYYRAAIKNSAGALCFNSVSDTVRINNPAVLTTVPGSRCGPGTVTLGATGVDGVLAWWAAATGGTRLDTGVTYTTPSIAATTNYYVSSSASRAGNATIGLGAATSNTGTGGNFEGTSPYAYHWGNYKHQMLVRASDLIAAGAGAGQLNSISFDVASVGVASFLNFSISMKQTAATALVATFETPVTGVYSAASVTPTVGINTYTFPVPFMWDGTSNIIVQVCFNNDNSGSVANSAEVKYDVTPYISHNIFRGDGVRPTVCSEVAGNASNDGPITSKLPKMIFGYGSACESPRTLVVATINPRPDTTVTVTGPTTFCAGGFVALSAVAGYTYQWLLNNAVIAGATSVTHNATLAGSYRVVVSSATCSDTSNARTVTLIAAPTATATAVGPLAFCPGDSTLLVGPAIIAGNTYQWQKDGVNIAGATTDSLYASTAGAYRLVLFNGTCADTSTALAVTINALPTINVLPATPTVCQGSSVALTASGAATYTWSPATGLSATTGATVTATPNFTLTYTITGTDVNGCKNTTTKEVIVNARPAIIFTPASAGVCTGGSVIITASGASTYSWSPATGLSATTGATVTSTPVATITYTVTGTSAAGCVNTATKQVVVTTIPNVTVTPAAATTVCAGIATTLTANGATTYNWSPSTGLSATTGTTVTATPLVTTTYTVVGSTNGCTGTSTKTITVNPLPTSVITAGGATNFCQGGSVVLSANTGAGLSYDWRRNGASTGISTSTYTATLAGTYDVIVFNGTCPATSNAIIVIVSTPPAPVITAAGPTSICQGTGVVLSTGLNAAYTYVWKLNGVNIAGANANTHTATAAGNYTVEVTNGTCVVLSAPITVTVNQLPPAQVLPQGATTFCDGDAVSLFASLPSVGTFTYQWYKDAATISGANGAVYIAVASGNYSVMVSDANCSATSTAVNVIVHPMPTIPAIIVTSGNILSTGSYVSYQWFRNGIMISGATSQTYTAIQDGDYTVLVGNFAGCEALSPVQNVSSVGVVGVAPGSLKIYPNPAKDVIHIQTDRVVNVSFTSVDGREILSVKNAKDVNIGHLADGTYLLKVTDKEGHLLRTEKVNKLSR